MNFNSIIDDILLMIFNSLSFADINNISFVNKHLLSLTGKYIKKNSHIISNNNLRLDYYKNNNNHYTSYCFSFRVKLCPNSLKHNYAEIVIENKRYISNREIANISEFSMKDILKYYIQRKNMFRICSEKL